MNTKAKPRRVGGGTRLLNTVLPALNRGKAFAELRRIAAQYVRDQLSAEDDCPRLHTEIAGLYLHAARQFLSKDNDAAAKRWRDESHKLTAAHELLARDLSIFKSHMQVAAPAAERALRSIAAMAADYAGYAEELDRDRKNITYFHCLKRVFTEAKRPVPTNALAFAAYDVMYKIAPGDAMPSYDEHDVAQLMQYKPRR